MHLDGGDKVSIVPFVYYRGMVGVSSLGYFSSIGSSSKPSHPSLPLSLGAYHIQEYFKKKRRRKRKFIRSSFLDFSYCGLMNFCFLPLFFLKYS